jgi:hypothetical protein
MIQMKGETLTLQEECIITVCINIANRDVDRFLERLVGKVVTKTSALLCCTSPATRECSSLHARRRKLRSML